MSPSPVWQEIQDLFEPALLPLRALVVTLAGVLLALVPASTRWIDRVLPLALIGLAAILVARGGQAILHRVPRIGLALMEVWIVAPLVVGVLASAAVAYASVALAVPEKVSESEKVLLASLATGINAFLTAAFIAWTTDRDNSRLAQRARRAFQSKYVRQEPGQKLPEGTAGVAKGSDRERLVYGEAVAGIEGWSFQARWKRATRLGRSNRRAVPP